VGTVTRWIVVAVLLGLSRAAIGAPLAVVLRDGGEAALAITRLRGQLADLDVEIATERAPIEAALHAQLSTATRMAASHHARAVVWFTARGGGIVVAIATPADHRLFVREIPAGDASAVAEAAAVAVRGALRAIGEGGTIGIEVAAPPTSLALPAPAPAPAPAEDPSPPIGVEVAVGWQIVFDAGADAGAQALAQRTSVTRGAWAGNVAVSLGPALRRDAPAAAVPGLAIELSRSTATLGVERRFAGFALGAAAGVVVYHRSTVAILPELAATPAATTIGFVGGPELRWQWRPGGGHLGVEAVGGLDVVAGAPEPVVARGQTIQSLGALRTVQPRVSLRIVVGLP
jgi:hypothetical protein